MNDMQGLIARGQQLNGASEPGSVLSRIEAEHIIESLEALPIEEVGSSKWQAQHDALTQLNLQAHYNARTHSDEYVVDLLVSLDRVKVLVHDLLAIEAWRELVLPHLQDHIAKHVDSVSTYMLLYHEVTITNLIEVTLFHTHVCEAIPEDYLLELADWIYRKLMYLNSKEVASFSDSKEMSAADMMALSELDDFKERARELSFASSMGALSILRYLTELIPTAPLGMISRLVSTNDTLMALLPLLERPPWVRRRAGRTERWGVEGGMRWSAVEAEDRLKLGQYEIQIWLAINNLVVDPRARAKYTLDEYRRERLMGLKRYLNELMFDQLPVLKDLQRVCDELALGMSGSDKESSKQAGLILEQVPEVRDDLLRGRNWKAVAKMQRETYFARGRAGMDKKRVEALSKMFDQMCGIELGDDPGLAAAMAALSSGASPEAAAAAAAAASLAAAGPASNGSGYKSESPQKIPGPVRVECRRKVHESGVWEPWCDFSLAVDPSRPPDPVEVAGPAGGLAPARVVHGLRYRLEATEPESAAPLPTNGKIIVKVPSFSGKSTLPKVAEALLQLPEAELQTAVSELPPIVWVTVGLLATDGFALQLKLKRADKAQQRDKMSGVWYAYHPCGGALTILRGDDLANRASTAAPHVSSEPPKIQVIPGKAQEIRPPRKEAPAAAAAAAVVQAPSVILQNDLIKAPQAPVPIILDDDLNLPD